MVYCQGSNSLLFIGSPAVDGLDDLTENNLFMSDIPLYDATREVILIGEQARAQVIVWHLITDFKAQFVFKVWSTEENGQAEKLNRRGQFSC